MLPKMLPSVLPEAPFDPAALDDALAPVADEPAEPVRVVVVTPVAAGMTEVNASVLLQEQDES